jgi:DNA-binding Lrp family transcriptional regulator
MNNNEKAGNGTPIKRLSKKFYKFYFVHPPKNADADRLAEQLIGIKNVEEVFVTDGDYGFVVKARFFEGKEPDDAQNFLLKKMGGNFGKVTSYYQYKK